MAGATFDIVNVLKRELPECQEPGRERGAIPASTVAFLSGISSGTLSKYLNGSVRCPNDHELRLRNALSALKKLIERTRPLPLDFKRVTDIERSINMVEAGTLAIVIFETELTESEVQQQK